MKIRTRLLIVTSLFASILSPAMAQDETTPESAAENLPAALPAQKLHTFNIYWENDGTILKRNNATDRHYTNGAGFNFAWQPQWADSLAPYMPFADDFGPARTAAGISIQHMIFTPDDITNPRIIRNDWPYVGYFATGLYWQRANENTMDHFQLDLGMIGPSTQASELQKSIHEWRNIDKPQGWDHQQGDSFNVQAYLRKKWLVDIVGNPADAENDGKFGIQVIPQLGVALGTVFRRLEADVTLRIGVNLPRDFGPGRLADAPAEMVEMPDGFFFYGYGRVGGRWVQHNKLLAGIDFRLDEKPWFGELQGGLATGYRKGNFSWSLTYSQTFLSDQFEGQSLPDAFGALALQLQWEY